MSSMLLDIRVALGMDIYVGDTHLCVNSLQVVVESMSIGEII